MFVISNDFLLLESCDFDRLSGTSYIILLVMFPVPRTVSCTGHSTFPF